VVRGHQDLGMLGLGSGVLDRDGRLGPSLRRYVPASNAYECGCEGCAAARMCGAKQPSVSHTAAGG
jgi:hypothetical protein